MTILRNTIIEILEEHAGQEDMLFAAVSGLYEAYGKDIYGEIIHILTHIDLDNKEAEQVWQSIASHYQEMNSILGRKVSLQTVMCDYFCTVHKYLINPKVIEINLFEETARLSKYDDLTGLLNKRVFNEAFSSEVSRAERHVNDLSFLFFDLDDFKAVNDTYGHEAGDSVLAKVAGIITRNKRHEDVAARWGGEEFVLLLPETSKKDALEIGERIRREVATTVIPFQRRTIRTTVSGGLASFPYDTPDAKQLKLDADAALYVAKRTGKNRIVKFSEDKRRYIRVECDSQVTFRMFDFDDNDINRGFCRNISRGGMLFECDTEFEIGSQLLTGVNLTDDRHKYFTGSVVRVDEQPEKRYEVGLSFHEMDWKSTRELVGYIMGKI